MRSVSGLFVLAVVAGIVGVASAADLYVPGGYATIQAAVDAANPGDAIHVAAGLYTERVVIGKGVTLLGATSDVNKNGYAVPASYNWNTAVESVISYPDPAGQPTDQVAVDIRSDNVTFKGFVVEILNARVGSDHLLRLDAQIAGGVGTYLSNIVVENNVLGPVTNVASQDGTYGRMGLYLASPTYPAQRQGIKNTHIAGNKIIDARGNGSTVFIWGAAEAYNSVQNADYTGTVIEDNEICGSHRSGIELAGGVDNLTIRGNSIHDNSSTNGGPADANLKYGNGLLLIRMGGDKMSPTARGCANLTVQENDIYANEKNGIYLGPINSGYTISGNVIRDNGWDGLRLDLTEQYYGGTWPVYDKTANIALAECSLTGNALKAVQVVGAPTNGFILDASGSWFGSTAAATVAGSVSGYVDYSPWLGGGSLLIPGFDGDYSTVWVDDDSPQAKTVTPIQEGVNLASGSTVNVLNGTYAADPVTGEGVWITKNNLQLVGQSEAGVVIDGAIGGVGSSGSYWPRAIHVSAHGVGIRDMTIRNFTGDNVNTGGYGVVFRDWTHDTPAEGYVFYDGCTLENVTVEGCYSSVYALCFTHLEVAGCTVRNSLADGMFLARECDYVNVHDNVVTNSANQGIWVGYCWSALGPSDHAVIKNNVVDGAMEGGISFVHSDDALIEGNTITNVAGDGWSAGALSLKDGPSNVVARYNLITGNDGSWGGYSGTGHGVGIDGTPSAITLRWNRIYDNTGDGCHNYSTVDVDGTYNWWGDASGPSGVGPGSGDQITTHVLYDPWIGKSDTENIVCDPDPLELTAAAGTGTVDVDYLGGAPGLVYLVHVVFTWDDTKLTLNSVTKGDLFAGLSDLFYVTGIGNTRTVDWSLKGAQAGVTGPGTLFTASFTAVSGACGTSPITFTEVVFRDNSNNDIPGLYSLDGEVVLDLTAPTVSVSIDNQTNPCFENYAKNHDNLVLTATVSDACGSLLTPSANLSTLLSGGSSAAPPSDWTPPVATWTLNDVTLTGDGLKTVTVTATDLLGNVGTGSTTITVDNTAPGAVTDFAASPGHNKVVMVWTNPTDANPYEVMIRGNAWGDYPYYATSEPAYPADHTAGAEVWHGAGATYTALYPGDASDRDICYYQAFACDKAMNYGPAASTARDRSTNYWLGDVVSNVGGYPPNGYVFDYDIVALSSTYGQAPPVGYAASECNVGPTDDHSRLGIPLPNPSAPTINFEDLIIFAMNYGVVAPRIVPYLSEPADEALALSLAELAAGPEGEVQVALRLDGNVGEVKGLSTTITFDPSQLEFVSARLSDGMASPIAETFFWSGTDAGKVQVDLAVLGTGVTIGGSGEVAVLAFRALGSEYALGFDEALLRGVDNEDLTAELEGLESRPEVPTVFRLAQNAPNPFNPRTAVAYEVPQASALTIRVYDVTGRLVRTLVDGTVEPGRYSVEWDGTGTDGQSVGSGVYFCVMETPSYHATHKMMLLK